jgi:hypothetical protein
LTLLAAIASSQNHRHAALLCLLAEHGATFDGPAVEHDGKRLVIVMGDADAGLSGGVYIVSAFIGLEQSALDILNAIREHGEPAPKRPPVMHLPSCRWPERLCNCGAEQHTRHMAHVAKERAR